MKELSIEEKAKAYDEAIERAKYYYGEGKTLEYASDITSYIFPELAKSEDVVIKEKIIATIHLYYGEPLEDEAKEMIAWLEKQSTPQVRTGLEWVNTIDDACDKRYSEEYAHGEYCHEQSFKWGFQEGVDWLEKQGEQKDSVVDFKAKDWYVSKVDGKIHNIYHSVDKVEPKFKVGDIIRHKEQGFTIYGCWDMDNALKNCNDGDKVNVILIKED